MTILRVSQALNADGSVGASPAELAIDCNNTLSEVTTAGFLTSSAIRPYSLTAKDLVRLSYSGGVALFNVAISDGVITLSVNTHIDVTTVAGNFANFSNTTGGLEDSGYSPSNPLLSKVAMVAQTVAARYLAIFTDAAGTVSNETPAFIPVGVYIDNHNEPATYTIRDKGVVGADFIMSEGTNTMAATSQIILGKANGTEASNAVTANGNAGVITTSSLNTAAGGTYSITWTNSHIAAVSVITNGILGGTNTMDNYKIKIVPGNGSATMTIHNIDGSAAMNGTLKIGYVVF
jgi:hypothetical protein